MNLYSFVEISKTINKGKRKKGKKEKNGGWLVEV